MDNLRIELDGSEVVKGAQGAITALQELKAAILAFNTQDTAGRVRADIAALQTSAVGAVDAAAKALGGVTKAVEDAMKGAESAAKSGGKKTGKAFADGLAEEDPTDSVKSMRQRLQKEYEKAITDGKTFFTEAQLAAKSAFGKVQLTPIDTERLDAWKKANATFLQDARDTFQARKRFNAETEAEEARSRAALQAEANQTFQFRQRFLKATDAEAAQELAQLQRESNDTLRFRQNYARAVQQEQERLLTQMQTEANQTFRFRENYLKSQEQAAARELAQMQRESNDTLRFIQNWRKAEENELAQLREQRLTAVAGLAKFQFNAALPSANAYSSIQSGANFGRVYDPQADAVAAAAAAAEKEAAKASKDAAAAAKLSAAEQKKLKEAAEEAAPAQRKLADSSRDVHSAFRGAAAAGNALFLTYGSLIPLTTAFFAASSVRESITSYKDLEYQLKFVQAVAQDTSVSMKDMMDSVTKTALDTATSPLEAAKGLRILAQAGLDTTQALEALPTVLQVARVGELDMAKAAETLTGATFALGIGLDNISRVGDVFVKAAAVSNTSVSQIAESMKQASTVAQQYKLSVEDIGTALVALGKRNITGSQAGTAFRNMLDELASPKGDAKKVASILKIQLFDPMTNDAKDFFGKFVPDLRAKLKEFDPESQNFILNRLTNNRGAKALGAILGMTDEELGKIRDQLDHATGMAKRASMDLKDTLQGDFEELKSALAKSLSEAGSTSIDPLRDALQNLREVVSAPEFVHAVAGLVNAFSTLIDVLTKGASLVASPGGLIATFAGSVALLKGLAPAAGSAAAALTGTAEATGAVAAASAAAATGASGLLASLLRFAGVVGVLISVATAIGWVYQKLTDKTANEKSMEYIDKLIGKEHEYQQSVIGSIALLDRKANAQGAAQLGDLDQKIADASKTFREANDAIANAKGDAGLFGLKAKAAQAESDLSRLILMRQLLTNERAKSSALDDQLKAKELAAAKKYADEMSAAMGSGPNAKHFTLPDTGAAAADYSNYLKTVNIGMDLLEQAAKASDEAAKAREAALKTDYDRGVITFADYQKSLDEVQKQHSAERIDMMTREADTAEAAAKVLAEKATGMNATRGPGQKAANDAAELLKKVQSVRAEIQKLTDQDLQRQANALTEALKPYVEFNRDAGAKRAELQNNFNQELRSVDLKAQSLNLTERELAVQGEVNKALNGQEDALTKALELKSRMEREFGISGDSLGTADPTAMQNYFKLLENIQKLQSQISDDRGKISEAASKLFDAQKVKEMSDRLRDGIADGLMEGGQAGAKKVRDVLEEELLRKPFRMIIQAILQPITNGIAGAIYSSLGLGGGGSGSAGGSFLGGNGGALWSLGSSAVGQGSMGSLASGGGYIGSLGGSLGFGSSAAGAVGGSFASSVGGGLATDAMGATVAEGSAAATLGAGGSLAAAASTALPILAAAYAVYQIAQQFHGETRSGGQYGYSFNGVNAQNLRRGTLASANGVGATFLEGPSGGELDGGASKDLVNSTVASINQLLTGLGSSSKLTEFHAGLETSTRGRGGVLSGGTFSNGVGFGESGKGDNYAGTLFDKTKGFNLDGQQALTAFTLDLKQTTIQALQAATDIPKTIADKLKGVDAEHLSDQAATALLTDISTTVDGVHQLSAALDSSPFKKMAAASFDAKAALIKFSGGIDALKGNLQSFYQNFYSAGEQRQQTAKNIAATLSKAGFGDITAQQVLNTTREQFRALFEAIPTDTVAGQQAAAALLSVSDAFASITQASADSTTSLDGQLSALQGSQKALQDFQKSLQDFQKSLLLGSDSPLSPVDRYQVASNDFQDTLSKALAGDPEAQKNFQASASAFLSASKDVNASSDAYTSDFNLVQSAIAQLHDSSAHQIADSTNQITLLQQQLGVSQNIVDQVKGSGIDIVNAIQSVAANNDAMTAAQNAVDSLSKTQVAPYLNNDGSSGSGGGSTTALEGYFGSIGLGTPTDAQTSQYQSYLSQGMSSREASGLVAMYSPTGYAVGGLADGWSMVGEEGPELVNFTSPGRVYTASQTRQALGGGMSEELLSALIDEVRALREENNQGNQAIARGTRTAAEHTAAATSRAVWRQALAQGVQQ